MLDERQAIATVEQEGAREQLLREVSEFIVQQGLVDELARRIHDAGLGRALTTLAKPDAAPGTRT